MGFYTSLGALLLSGCLNGVVLTCDAVSSTVVQRSIFGVDFNDCVGECCLLVVAKLEI